MAFKVSRMETSFAKYLLANSHNDFCFLFDGFISESEVVGIYKMLLCQL